VNLNYNLQALDTTDSKSKHTSDTDRSSSYLDYIYIVDADNIELAWMEGSIVVNGKIYNFIVNM
jgi:hypothetical protein